MHFPRGCCVIGVNFSFLLARGERSSQRRNRMRSQAEHRNREGMPRAQSESVPASSSASARSIGGKVSLKLSSRSLDVFYVIFCCPLGIRCKRNGSPFALQIQALLLRLRSDLEFRIFCGRRFHSKLRVQVVFSVMMLDVRLIILLKPQFKRLSRNLIKGGRVPLLPAVRVGLRVAARKHKWQGQCHRHHTKLFQIL